MAKKIILGTDIARDAFKTKVNENFTELYDKDVALGESINDLDAEFTSIDLTSSLQNGWIKGLSSMPGILVTKTKNAINVIGVIKGGVLTKGTLIVDLPLEYRTKDTWIPVYQFGNPQIVRLARLSTNGNLYIDNNYDWVGSTYEHIINATIPIL